MSQGAINIEHSRACRLFGETATAVPSAAPRKRKDVEKMER